MAHNSVPWLALLRQHIYGHQDTKKPMRHNFQDKISQPTLETDTPPIKPRLNPPARTDPTPKPARDSNQPPHHKGALPIKVQINIACDKIAAEMTSIALGTIAPPIQDNILAPPYEGTCARLRIVKTWITAHYKKQYTMRTGPQH